MKMFVMNLDVLWSEENLPLSEKLHTFVKKGRSCFSVQKCLMPNPYISNKQVNKPLNHPPTPSRAPFPPQLYTL